MIYNSSVFNMLSGEEHLLVFWGMDEEIDGYK
jgi:hypothetical protein